jgi:hypothetical protein
MQFAAVVNLDGISVLCLSHDFLLF